MMVTAIALVKLAEMEIPMIELVQLAQKAENEFIGVNCGIMDQFAIGMGKKNHAIKLKCDTLQYEYFPIHIDGYKLVITNTNKRRGLTNSKYNERRRECEEGLRRIRRELPEIRSLGDLRYEKWRKIAHVIKDEVIRKRVEHVVSENERVLLATQSLKENDLKKFGELMRASHESLRDLYEVTGRELDVLFEAASRAEGCIGTRMTGAGFGGCSVSLVEEEKVERFKEVVSCAYAEKTGLVPSFYVCEIGDGAKEMTEEVNSCPSW
jgi:galactokinase